MPNILKRAFVLRTYFDPENQNHIESFKVFIRTGNWGNIQFHPELPFNEVPMTVLMKFASNDLRVQRESDEEKEARMSTMNLVQPTKAETRKEHQARLKASSTLILNQLADLKAKDQAYQEELNEAA